MVDLNYLSTTPVAKTVQQLNADALLAYKAKDFGKVKDIFDQLEKLELAERKKQEEATILQHSQEQHKEAMSMLNKTHDQINISKIDDFKKTLNDNKNVSGMVGEESLMKSKEDIESKLAFTRTIIETVLVWWKNKTIVKMVVVWWKDNWKTTYMDWEEYLRKAKEDRERELASTKTIVKTVVVWWKDNWKTTYMDWEEYLREAKTIQEEKETQKEVQVNQAKNLLQDNSEYNEFEKTYEYLEKSLFSIWFTCKPWYTSMYPWKNRLNYLHQRMEKLMGEYKIIKSEITNSTNQISWKTDYKIQNFYNEIDGLIDVYKNEELLNSDEELYFKKMWDIIDKLYFQKTLISNYYLK